MEMLPFKMLKMKFKFYIRNANNCSKQNFTLVKILKNIKLVINKI